MNKERSFFTMISNHGIRGVNKFNDRDFFNNINDGDEVKIMATLLYHERSIDNIEEILRKQPNTKFFLLLMDHSTPFTQCRAYDICKRTGFEVYSEAEPAKAIFPGPKETRREKVYEFINDSRHYCERVMRSSKSYCQPEKLIAGSNVSRLQVLLVKDYFGFSTYIKKSDLRSSLHIGFYLNDSAEKIPFLEIVDTKKNEYLSFQHINSYFNEKWDRNLMMLNAENRQKCGYTFLSDGLCERSVASIPHVKVCDINKSGFPAPPIHP